MIREHYAAVKALAPPGLTVHLWEVPKEPDYPYVLIWGPPGDELRDTLSETPRDYEARIKATYVGLSGDSVIGVAGRFRKAVNGKRPTVAGWSVGKLFHASLTDVRPDEDVTIPLAGHPMFAIDEFLLQSTRIV